MTEVFTSLPWQHQVLFVETIVSALIGLTLAYRGFQRTLGTMMFFLLWNVAITLLLVTGADRVSWQYVTILGLYLLDTTQVIRGGIQRVKTEPVEGTGITWFATFWVMGVLVLLVTGQG